MSDAPYLPVPPSSAKDKFKRTSSSASASEAGGSRQVSPRARPAPRDRTDVNPATDVNAALEAHQDAAKMKMRAVSVSKIAVERGVAAAKKWDTVANRVAGIAKHTAIWEDDADDALEALMKFDTVIKNLPKTNDSWINTLKLNNHRTADPSDADRDPTDRDPY